MFDLINNSINWKGDGEEHYNNEGKTGNKSQATPTQTQWNFAELGMNIGYLDLIPSVYYYVVSSILGAYYVVVLILDLYITMLFLRFWV